MLQPQFFIAILAYFLIIFSSISDGKKVKDTHTIITTISKADSAAAAGASAGADNGTVASGAAAAAASSASITTIVKTHHHTIKKCAVHEKYVKCPAKLCQPQMCDHVGFPICSHGETYESGTESKITHDSGDMECHGPAACVCVDNYVRDDEGVCIPVGECPSCGGDKNSTFGCGVNCGRRCSNYNKQNVTCPEICYVNSCDCKEEYVFDDNTGKCVLPEDCSSKETTEKTDPSPDTSNITEPGTESSTEPTKDNPEPSKRTPKQPHTKHRKKQTKPTNPTPRTDPSPDTSDTIEPGTESTTETTIEDTEPTKRTPKQTHTKHTKNITKSTKPTLKTDSSPETTKPGSECTTEPTTEDPESTKRTPKQPDTKHKKYLTKSTKPTLKTDPSPETTEPGSECTTEPTIEDTEPPKRTPKQPHTKHTKKHTKPTPKTDPSPETTEPGSECTAEPTTEDPDPTKRTPKRTHTKHTKNLTKSTKPTLKTDPSPEITKPGSECTTEPTTEDPEPTKRTPKQPHTKHTKKHTKPTKPTPKPDPNPETTEPGNECTTELTTEDPKPIKRTPKQPHTKHTKKHTKPSKPTPKTDTSPEATEPGNECTTEPITEDPEPTKKTPKQPHTKHTKKHNKPTKLTPRTGPSPEATAPGSESTTEPTPNEKVKSNTNTTEIDPTKMTPKMETTSTPGSGGGGSHKCSNKHEKYYECASECPEYTCSDYFNGNTTYCHRKGQKENCEPGCRCRPFHYRNTEGQCVKGFQCRKSSPSSTSTSSEPTMSSNSMITTSSESDHCSPAAYNASILANLAFNAKILAEVVKQNPDKNVVISGSSILYLLSETIILTPTSEDSTKEILQAIALTIDEIKCFLPKSFGNISVNGEIVGYSFTYRLYADLKCELTDKFIDQITETFTLGPQNINFSDPAAVNIINDEVANITDIEHFIKPDLLASLSCLLLVDAKSFRGEWESKFDAKDTTEHLFFGSNHIEKIPMMYQRGTYLYAENRMLGYKVLKLKYKAGFTCAILLPDHGIHIDTFVTRLSAADQVAKTFDSLKRIPMDIYIPKFNVSTASRMKQPIIKSGIKAVFNQSTANLKDVASSESPYVSELLQKITLTIDETGTDVVPDFSTTDEEPINPHQYRKKFKANRPFVYYILYEKVLLFAGVFTR